MSPLARIKLGLRVALRRRYGYAALRVLRRSAARAIVDDFARSIGPESYVYQGDEIRSAYWQALQRLRRRWPRLDLDDPRSRS